MPFLGQDWRSPGWSWIKTEDGWKRCEPWSEGLEGENDRCGASHGTILNSEDEEIFNNEEHEYASKKRKKDHFRNDKNTQCFYREKWIYVHKESTRERHGYCTLGEAFNRLDFFSAVQDARRFTYVARLLQLIAKSQLTSLSGVAQKNYFNVLDKIVQKVLDDHQNPRLIKDLLQDLSSTLCILIRGVGKSVLVGNINIWVCRLETILNWQQQLQNLQMTEVDSGLTLSDLPVHMLSNILYRFSDGWDIVTLGQVTPTLSALSEDRRLWKKLCQYHFGEKQFCRHLILSEKGHIEWKLMYFALQKHYPTKEQYGDTLHFCRHCSILFWKDCRLALLLEVPPALPASARVPRRLVPLRPHPLLMCDWPACFTTTGGPMSCPVDQREGVDLAAGSPALLAPSPEAALSPDLSPVSAAGRSAGPSGEWGGRCREQVPGWTLTHGGRGGARPGRGRRAQGSLWGPNSVARLPIHWSRNSFGKSLPWGAVWLPSFS
ncbi:F-box only protein 25 isoform X2 [Monodon monoceros]|uniref:F-box only protein 25 isoform X2 n=1 Tax=Monodon monoceros TaxID=40151 RepID=UPI0010F4EF5D|nr:F-box only protein 25 isoform X2 [Monodon monoceros]